MPASSVLLPVSLVAGAAGHGLMTLPTPRQGGGDLSKAVVFGNFADNGWYTNNVNPKGDPERIEIPGEPTLCEQRMLTTAVGGHACTDLDPFRRRPWRAPGTAPILSPCGVYGGGPPCGVEGAYGCDTKGLDADGRDLPPTARTAWQRGGTARVAWAIQANHGGGYAWRLCPAGEELTEACFQRHHLQFAGETSIVHWVNGTEIAIPLVKTSNGTSPAGSQWARNPIPGRDGRPFPAPCQDCETCANGNGCPRHADHNFSIIDTIRVPNLPVGNYVLSWRWDCEVNPQVWNNCADVSIVENAQIV